MSLNDAIRSDINLSSEDLQRIASQLILQQNFESSKGPQSRLRITCDSDGGFSSECSDSYNFTAATANGSFASCSQLASFTDEILLCRPKARDKSSEESDSTRGSLHTSNSDGCLSPHQVLVKKKGRGGWPKGRKRKPELLNLPPKAPATGYNLYLNEQRSFFKDSSLPFYEITKIIGNRWSSLNLDEKKPYLERAEEEKKRYREELKQYRQSEAYRAYLNKKRKKRMQNNVLSESDMDATDDFDEEDNEELYCRTCDQWFHSLHNKKEHLQAKKHLTSLAGDMHRELSDIESSTTIKTESSMVSNSLDESSLEGSTSIVNRETNNATTTVYEAMCQVASLLKKREQEIGTLKIKQQKLVDEQEALCQQLNQLSAAEAALQKDLSAKREIEKELEAKVFHLWQVPSLCVMAKFDAPKTHNGTHETT
ncbi:hypothetical protein ABEB36_005850 [Hypothenemus hampei]